MMITDDPLVDPDYSTVRMCSRAFQNDGNSYAILVLASVLVITRSSALHLYHGASKIVL